MVIFDWTDFVVVLNCSKGDNISYYSKKWNLFEALFEYCKGCREMASIPQGAFAACKMRSYSNDDTMSLARIQNVDKQDSKKFGNKEMMQYTPVKYNSKLMNSIWGLYNRYSPHNIKGNDDDLSLPKVTLQQIRSVAAYTVAQNVIGNGQSGDEWNFPRKSNF